MGTSEDSSSLFGSETNKNISMEVKALFATTGFRDVHLVFGRHHLGECIAAVGNK